MPPSHTSRDRAHLAGIFIVALAVLAYQVLLTRIFSVVLFYHYAFVGISLAMLGLTIGAVKVFLHEKRFVVERVDEEWARAALGFSVTGAVFVLAFLYMPFVLPKALLGIEVLAPVCFVVPFTYSGICVTLILTKSPVPIGKLYAADLIGAALGCMGIVGMLFYLDPVSLIFGLAAMTAFAAWGVVRSSRTPLASQAKLLGCFWLLAFALQGGLYLTDQAHLRIKWAKFTVEDNTVYERWNTYSRIRVTQIPKYENLPPQGWGFGHEQTQPTPQLFLSIDADAGTVITHFDGNLKALSFLSNDIINMAYHVRPVSNVAVIGVGGGRDILSALYFRAHHITGLEMNPAIFDALTDHFAYFSGYLDRRSDVSLVNAEARSWLNQTPQSFDLIQISLIDTWAATAAGGLTLSENKLYTADAWTDFLGRLNPNGMLSVSRWFDPENHKGEFYRLLSLAVDALERSGVPASDVRRHILAFNVGKIITVVISRSPLTPADITRTKKAVAKEGFKIMLSPDTSWDDVSDTIASGKADKAFYAALPIDVTASTDDRPFFFYMTRPLNLLLGGADQSYGESGMSNMAVCVILFLLVATTLCVIGAVFHPLHTLAKPLPVKAAKPYLAYFASIGLGFMLIEISQMQRLMIFLGHPVYGLTVVLFTLLLFGGIGSSTVTAAKNARSLWRWPAALCLILCVLGFITPAITEHLKHEDIAARIFASIALMAPAGFGMGMMFPVGMLMSRKYHDLQPWFWGINGATSVFASVVGVIISMQYGITAAYWTGVACYAVCLAITWRLAKT